MPAARGGVSSTTDSRFLSLSRPRGLLLLPLPLLLLAAVLLLTVVYVVVDAFQSSAFSRVAGIRDSVENRETERRCRS